MSTREPQSREPLLWRLNRWMDTHWLSILAVALVAAILALVIFWSTQGEGWVAIGAWGTFAGLANFLLLGLLIKLIEWVRRRADDRRTL